MCEDKLICDLAETYHVFNYREFSPEMVGTLFFGLRDNSRTKMFLSKQKITLEQTLLAIIADYLSFMAWAETKDAQQGYNRPKSIYEILTSEPEEKEYLSFNTLEEFEEARQRIIGGG